MKYIVRILVLPFWATAYLIFNTYYTLIGLFKISYGFIVYGGEQITHNHKDNRNTIFEVYQKIEQMELNSKVDPRSQCNHVWEQEVPYGATSQPRQKCVVCGVSFNNNHFTQ
jgi:hypothetical protein